MAEFAFVRSFPENTSRTPGGAERWERDLTSALIGQVDALGPDDEAPHPYQVVQGQSEDAVRIAREAHARLVVTFHGTAWLSARHGYRTGRRGLYRLGQTAMYAREAWHNLRALRRISAAVCVSRKVRAHLHAQTRRYRAKITLIENGVDLAAFHPPATPQANGRVLFYGRLETNKGLLPLVEAVGSDIPLDVAGAGSLEPWIREVARNRPNIRVLGALPQTDLVNAIGAAQLVCTPSLNETFGLVGIEALACGTPAVLTDEFDIHGKSGSLLVRCRFDPASIRNAISAAMPLKTPAWTRQAREAVTREYDFQGRARAYLALYRHLAEGGEARAFTHPEAAAPWP